MKPSPCVRSQLAYASCGLMWNMRTCIPDMRACDSSPSFLRKKIREWNKKKFHIKRPEQTCSVHCLNMYSDDGPGLIFLSFGSRNRITESYYFIYTCTRFTIKKCVVLHIIKKLNYAKGNLQHVYLILVTNFILIVGPRKTLAQIHVICSYNFLNSAFVGQN
jgi:hypothetical protein